MNGINRSTTIKRAAHQVSCSRNDEWRSSICRAPSISAWTRSAPASGGRWRPSRRALCQAVADRYAVSDTGCETRVTAFLRRSGGGLIEIAGIRGLCVRSTCSVIARPSPI
jgi:hypothetical protein